MSVSRSETTWWTLRMRVSSAGSVTDLKRLRERKKAANTESIVCRRFRVLPNSNVRMEERMRRRFWRITSLSLGIKRRAFDLGDEVLDAYADGVELIVREFDLGEFPQHEFVEDGTV